MKTPKKFFLVQKPMLRVASALVPLVLASIYFFGWRSLVMTCVVLICGIGTEALFTFKKGKPVTSAVFVTCLIFSLSLPPTVPFWMAVIGIVTGVAMGKMMFGGFGFNAFNPAMVGRCFIYITFPLQMTNQWIEPFRKGLAGLSQWSGSVDALTSATPLGVLHEGTAIPLPLLDLVLGRTSGSIGETSAILIVIGGLFIIYKKAASWRLALSFLLGGTLCTLFLRMTGMEQIPPILFTLTAGSFLFGTFFVATEPVSGAKTKLGQWIYGSMIGILIIILRGFSNFSEGVMFSVLIMNAFAPLLDQIIRQIQETKTRKVKA